mmetsp:Transcript_92668/g.224990  ORF Transcript_92668/g.224990 Transcript_92668/m.224990 type:complete len:202 (+) Transcript_92668:200-805(+)
MMSTVNAASSFPIDTENLSIRNPMIGGDGTSPRAWMRIVFIPIANDRFSGGTEDITLRFVADVVANNMMQPRLIPTKYKGGDAFTATAAPVHSRAPTKLYQNSSREAATILSTTVALSSSSSSSEGAAIPFSASIARRSPFAVRRYRSKRRPPIGVPTAPVTLTMPPNVREAFNSESKRLRFSKNLAPQVAMPDVTKVYAA